jgi:DNA repair protein RadC
VAKATAAAQPAELHVAASAASSLPRTLRSSAATRNAVHHCATQQARFSRRYARTSLPDFAGDVAHQGESFVPADPNTIIDSATAILQHRLRRGAKILGDPGPLLRFLQLRLVSQPRPVFAAFFLDRHQRLIRFAELFHGQNDTVPVRPKEVVREVLACNAEQILWVRSDPQGDHQPTSADVEDARGVTRAMNLLQIPVLDYVIVGKSVSSLRARGVLRI